MIHRSNQSKANDKRRCVVVSDAPSLALQVKEALTRRLWNCERDVVPTSQSASLQDSDHELVVCILPDNHMDVGQLLRGLRRDSHRTVVAAGPGDNAQLILKALHEGLADEFVELSRLDKDLGDVLERLHPAERGNLIAVVSPGGGGGASTLAANLAFAMSKAAERSLLVDLSLGFGVQACLFDLNPESSIVDLCRNIHRLDREMFQLMVTSHTSDVDLLAGAPGPGDARSITSDAVALGLEMAKLLYANCIIDADSSAFHEQADVYRNSDSVLLVFPPSVVGLQQVRRATDFLEEQGVPPSRVHLVVNGIGEPKQLTYAQVNHSLRDAKAFQLSFDPKHVNHANNLGVPALLGAPRCAYSKQVEALVRHIRESAPPTNQTVAKGRQMQ